jgi:hypothetical protein
MMWEYMNGYMGSYNIPNTVSNEDEDANGEDVAWVLFALFLWFWRACMNFDCVCELFCLELCYACELCHAFELCYDDEAMILNLCVIYVCVSWFCKKIDAYVYHLCLTLQSVVLQLATWPI